MAKNYQSNRFSVFAFVFTSVACSVLLFSLMRIGFYAAFSTGDVIAVNELVQAFYLGFKFDLRLALLIHLPILLLRVYPCKIFINDGANKWWSYYLAIAHVAIIAIYSFDFGHYDYLGSRIDATVLRFLLDPVISANMVWESYPIIWINIAYLAIISAYYWLIKKLICRFEHITLCSDQSRARYFATVTIVTLLVFGGLFGKLSQYPLRWSDAFFSTNSFVSSLASNPVIYFYDTFKNRESSYDLAKVEADYPLIADYLGVENHQHKKLDYLRHESADNAIAEQPNVVMVFLESFAYYKTGLSGNPMNPSPRFDQMANEGISFDRFYVPHGGTARSVFTAMTGLPDIEKQKTSSRNPLVVNQQLIINAFKNHSKHYFLGGSTSWGNIRGLLAHNIPDLQIHEDYQSNSNDIWGISDLHLFEEANQLLREEKEPFFAIIQTSGNHRPYTIPEDNRGFVSIEKDEDELAKMGFRSLADYNAFRFMDHSIGFYYDLIQQESYSNNTIFVFFADHGNNRQAKHMYKGEEALMLTEYHIPLVIYAPEFIKQPQVISTVGSEVDLFPTIADLAGTPYKNTTLGRSLFDKKHHDQRYAFTIMPGAKNRIGLISKDHYFLMNTNGSNKTLHSIFSDTPRQNIMGLAPEQAKKHEELTRGLFETIKYIRLNNKNSPEH